MLRKSKRLSFSPYVSEKPTMFLKHSVLGNRKRVIGSWSFSRMSKDSLLSPVRFLLRLGEKVANSIRVVSLRRRSSRKVSSSTLGETKLSLSIQITVWKVFLRPLLHARDVSCIHSKAVSNMHFTVLDNIDNLYEYNWAKAVHTFVVNSLGNASRKIRQGDIRDLGLSGNVAVLQLWAVERLGLADGAHDIVFPRIMNWRSLKLRSNKIEELFKRKEICWEWFLRDEDHQNSIICAALHLEEGSIAEDDGDELGLCWEQVVMKKIEDNQRKMVAMDKDLRSLATLVGVGKEDYEKGNDGKEEDGDVHGHGGAYGEGQCFQTFTYTDVGGCSEGLKDDVEDVMDIGPVVSTVPVHDDTEDDNLLNVNRTQLYNMVILFKLPWRVVSEICGQTFGTQECYSFGPRMQVGNTLFVPIIHDGHWWCYAVKIPSLEMFALDSFGHKRKERQKFDNVIAHNLALLFGHLLNCAKDNRPSLEVQHLHTPIQPNKFDCGVIVLKIMELWDGIDKYERKTMPSYTTEELQQVREHYVCQWILDVDNVGTGPVCRKNYTKVTTYFDFGNSSGPAAGALPIEVGVGRFC
ncbi:hypothetical protein LR48_Vigan01g177100 [Vigna angularis]|uniref:Ubiquitin-like protease family profile domain-containing protein n=1 Tax=Phaseolus angularis TaxID=3914 RepID=A0A0L9TNT5_PHAAN|nr:hypothetical protein LR48_Vigan01g177100 [Vigna angularis]